MVALGEIFESLAAPELLRIDPFTSARERTTAALELGCILKADFEQTLGALGRGHDQPGDRRAVVRCFGSLIDGLVHALRTVAEVACLSEGRQHHILLQDKSDDPSSGILQRVCISYRIISRCLPKSPVTKLQAKRWDELKAALEIRNRIIHPEAAADLEVSPANLRLITDVARQFIQDFQTFSQWHCARQPSLTGAGGRGPRRRRAGRRFRQCTCGSQRKYKNCCARAKHAA